MAMEKSARGRKKGDRLFGVEYFGISYIFPLFHLFDSSQQLGVVANAVS